MLPIIVGLAIALFLAAGASTAQVEPERGPLPKPPPPIPPPVQGTLPPFVQQVIVSGNASNEDLARAAFQAKNAGYPKLSQALAERIKTGASKSFIKSPWKDVTDAAWTRFARVICNDHAPNYVSPKGFYGLFQLGVRRLVDLGVMTKPKGQAGKDPTTGAAIRIWRGTWLIPEDKFLQDPEMQYKLFLKSMELYRSIIAEKYKQVIGLRIFDNKPATLSGLLALAHSAGSEGMHKWLMNGDIRKKFTWVTEAYERANNIF